MTQQQEAAWRLNSSGGTTAWCISRREGCNMKPGQTLCAVVHGPPRTRCMPHPPTRCSWSQHLRREDGAKCVHEVWVWVRGVEYPLYVNTPQHDHTHTHSHHTQDNGVRMHTCARARAHTHTAACCLPKTKSTLTRNARTMSALCEQASKPMQSVFTAHLPHKSYPIVDGHSLHCIQMTGPGVQ